MAAATRRVLSSSTLSAVTKPSGRSGSTRLRWSSAFVSSAVARCTAAADDIRWASSRAIWHAAATGSVSRRVTSAAEAASCASARVTPASAVPTAWPSGVDFLPREGKRGTRPLEGDLVWPWVDHEEQLPLLDLLIVVDRKVDDMPVHLGSDADEVGAHGGVVGPRTGLPLPDRDRHGGRGAHENERAHRAAQHAPPAGGRLIGSDVGSATEHAHPDDEGDGTRPDTRRRGPDILTWIVGVSRPSARDGGAASDWSWTRCRWDVHSALEREPPSFLRVPADSFPEVHAT